MRCKNCSKVNKHSVRSGNKCWRLWMLCPSCATIIHKDKYPSCQIVLWSKGKNLKKGLNTYRGNKKHA